MGACDVFVRCAAINEMKKGMMGLALRADVLVYTQKVLASACDEGSLGLFRHSQQNDHSMTLPNCKKP